MHDWILISVHFDWMAARVIVRLRNDRSHEVSLVAEAVSALSMSQRNDWGPSASINKVIGPNFTSANDQVIEIQMQSGDRLEIRARSFQMPTVVD